MQRLGQPLDHVAGFMNLATLDRRMSAEGSTDDFAQCLGTVDDKQPTDFRVEPALDQIVNQRRRQSTSTRHVAVALPGLMRRRPARKTRRRPAL
jgi:hypothetical protein